MTRDGKFIFAAAPYSNAAPLIECLDAEVIYGHPSQLVGDLLSGKTDAALIPVVDLFRNPELTMIEGLGVAADGAVQSVLLKCNVPLEQVQTVGRDPASSTSNMLAKILLENHFSGGTPSPASADSGDAVPPCRQVEMIDGEEADAVVVIGDRALCSEPATAGDIDLAEAWKEMTGLPFVFAVWGVRKDFPNIGKLSAVAFQSLGKGFQSLEKIAVRYAEQFQCPGKLFHDYLRDTIIYKVDGKVLEGMELFRKLWQINSTGNEWAGGMD
ncbi:MAG: menaquinone biosynthesis protein [Kiritimatiellales bacterium]|nr:menaquinone biosynthesis protein [Kiritimatiellales bacterium]